MIPGASVTVSSGDSGPTVATVKASDRGLGTVESLPPGRYSIRAEFPGFEPGQLKGVQLRGGDNRHVIVLKLSSVKESVQVEQDKVVAAANPRTAFGATLTPEEINALSDDPAEMAQQLIDMAGGNAVIRVDSFVGGPLPPKSLIKSIHIVRDTFAAENHSAEARSDRHRHAARRGARARRRSIASARRIDERQQSVRRQKGPEQIQNYDVDLGGTVVPQKSSFSLSGGEPPIVRHADFQRRVARRRRSRAS